MSANEALVVCQRTLTFKGKVYRPGDRVPVGVWQRTPYQRRVVLASQGYVYEGNFPLDSST